MTRKSWDHGGRTTTERGYGREHQRMREHLKATVILCEHCAAATPSRVRLGEIADHRIPLAKGGTGELSNYQWLCRPCADAKDAKDRGKPLKVKRTTNVDGWPV